MALPVSQNLERHIAHVFVKLENNPKAKQVIKFCRPDFVVKVTIKGKRNNRDRGMTTIVTYGKPNYQERKYIKKILEMGKFPINVPVLIK